MKAKLWMLGFGVVIGLLLVLVGWRVMAQKFTYYGSLIDPAAPAADFELVDQNGQLFRLSDQRGNVVLIFFGYTHCPDVCPVTLSRYKEIKSGMGKLAEKVRFVYITVDPERDTTEKIGAHLALFDGSFVGLTGALDDLERVWQEYGVYREVRDEASAAGYLVDHTARIYVIDGAGDWRLTYPYNVESSGVVQDLRHLALERR